MTTTDIHESLPSYLEAVEERVRILVGTSALHPRQRALLARIVYDDGWRTLPLRHALAPFYFLVRAHGSSIGTAALHLGAGLLLAQRCMCLIDDVQDDELAGAAADAGSVLAINGGLTLFLLGVDELLAADLGPGVWRSFHAHALRLSRAQ
ncbi:MAG TPA: hypothetical protein VFG69_03075, partial [Nannocystaceae bacterium]|nr:hypothetical protein [Nannocystaceae bacterium]